MLRTFYKTVIMVEVYSDTKPIEFGEYDHLEKIAKGVADNSLTLTHTRVLGENKPVTSKVFANRMKELGYGYALSSYGLEDTGHEVGTVKPLKVTK